MTVFFKGYVRPNLAFPALIAKHMQAAANCEIKNVCGNLHPTSHSPQTHFEVWKEVVA